MYPTIKKKEIVTAIDLQVLTINKSNTVCFGYDTSISH